jgi:hypothetical protein
MTALVAPAVRRILQAIADLQPGEGSETGAREGNLLETLELFYDKGLLQEARGATAESAAPVPASVPG